MIKTWAYLVAISIMCLTSSLTDASSLKTCKESVVINNKKDVGFGAIIDPPTNSDYSVWFPIVPKAISVDSEQNIIIGDTVKFRIL